MIAATNREIEAEQTRGAPEDRGRELARRERERKGGALAREPKVRETEYVSSSIYR